MVPKLATYLRHPDFGGLSLFTMGSSAQLLSLLRGEEEIFSTWRISSVS